MCQLLQRRVRIGDCNETFACCLATDRLIYECPEVMVEAIWLDGLPRLGRYQEECPGKVDRLRYRVDGFRHSKSVCASYSLADDLRSEARAAHSKEYNVPEARFLDLLSEVRQGRDLLHYFG